MLAFLDVGLEDKKGFLVTAACCRRHWDRLTEAGDRQHYRLLPRRTRTQSSSQHELTIVSPTSNDSTPLATGHGDS
jgi:hypothetical protein